jgi:hypothetical protein
MCRERKKVSDGEDDVGSAANAQAAIDIFAGYGLQEHSTRTELFIFRGGIEPFK